MAGRLLAVLSLALFVPAVLADDPKLPDVPAFDKLVVDTLRDVHNKGADLYNQKKEFDGTYRMYQGALLTVRPFLAHRPAAQKLIDEGLAAAEAEPGVAQKAFRLHEAIEAVRKHLREVGMAPAKLVEPTEVAPKPKEKGPGPAPAGGKGLSGKVTFNGQPLAAAEVTLVTLDQLKPRVFTTPVQAGNYSFAELPPGKYAVIVTGKGVPEKYQTTLTSGLTVEVKAGGGSHDLELK
jgi:hypothetical protein